MKKNLMLSISLSALIIAGCGNNQDLYQTQDENAKLKQEIARLEAQNDDLRNRLTQYEPLPEKAAENPAKVKPEKQPVELADISFDKSGVTAVHVSLINKSPKIVDAIEFVVLQFDNFGRPAYRFNDQAAGNTTSELLLQGSAAPGEVLRAAWTLYNTEKTVKGKVVIKQVHFSDGAVWKNLNFAEQVKQEKESYE